MYIVQSRLHKKVLIGCSDHIQKLMHQSGGLTSRIDVAFSESVGEYSSPLFGRYRTKEHHTGSPSPRRGPPPPPPVAFQSGERFHIYTNRLECTADVEPMYEATTNIQLI